MTKRDFCVLRGRATLQTADQDWVRAPFSPPAAASDGVPLTSVARIGTRSTHTGPLPSADEARRACAVSDSVPLTCLARAAEREGTGTHSPRR